MTVAAEQWNRPADRIRDDAAARYDQVRGMPQLTAQAKQALIARIHVAASGQMQASAARTSIERAAQLNTARRKVFGIEDVKARAGSANAAATDLSFRDAQDRVARCETPQEAEELYNRAHATGDELLARAVGNAAIEQHLAGFTGYDGVLDQYLDDRPAQRAALEAYKPLVRGGGLNLADAWEHVLPVPAELDGLTPDQMNALAAESEAMQTSAATLAGLPR